VVLCLVCGTKSSRLFVFLKMKGYSCNLLLSTQEYKNVLLGF